VRPLAPLPEGAGTPLGEAQAPPAVRGLRRADVPSEVAALDPHRPPAEVDVWPAELEAKRRRQEEEEEENRAVVIQNRTYANVHSMRMWPGGEIRGQIISG
jgi:hypothetical protein